ncbi:MULTISPECIES: LytR/AlgR family response regulator transcription factor [unclassified Chryseobacterium]|uniref:LytR/AlgR family response regulator transcription factor n=1 Tax=unclassified Chryseobacterium TaxID=2593645 RepID=UPI000D70F390|nr:MULTISPECIES: LytTR family DNA-binding domain-containing protein [unclassified Chryseobacterium]PWW26339.1 LytTR family two component transcriptional regulator [Chryseobacterium sp. AG844]
MNKLKCIIVDDEPLAISLLEHYVEKIPFLELVFSTENPIHALEYLQKNDSDLIFLDIQMPELTGINFMKIVGTHQKYILTTAYSEYALEGYEHNVVDYLLKPVSFERFQKSVLKAQERFSFPKEENTHFYIKSSGQRHRVSFNEILYIESIKDYVNIRTENDEYIVLDTLKSMESQLPEKFVRVHKSFIINLDKVKSIGAKKVILPDDEIPIGESYRADLLDRIS